MIIDNQFKKKMLLRDVFGSLFIFIVIFFLKIGLFYLFWDKAKISELIWPMAIVYFLVWISTSFGLYMRSKKEL